MTHRDNRPGPGRNNGEADEKWFFGQKYIFPKKHPKFAKRLISTLEKKESVNHVNSENHVNSVNTVNQALSAVLPPFFQLKSYWRYIDSEVRVIMWYFAVFSTFLVQNIPYSTSESLKGIFKFLDFKIMLFVNLVKSTRSILYD